MCLYNTKGDIADAEILLVWIPAYLHGSYYDTKNI